MRSGSIEALKVPANPLDVLAQQLVAMTAMDTWQVDDLLAMVRRAAPFASLPESAFTARRTSNVSASRSPSVLRRRTPTDTGGVALSLSHYSPAGARLAAEGARSSAPAGL